jgi:hypothetical protein
MAAPFAFGEMERRTNAMFAKSPQWSQCKTKKIHCVHCENIAHIAFVVAMV